MKLGYEMKSGETVDVPVTHTIVSALTGGGKTEAVLRLMHGAAAAGYTVLALDVKAKPRDFEGVGHEIRPYISESTEPLLMMRMLQSVAGANLFSRFSTILDACMDTERVEDVKANFDTIRDNKKVWSRKRDDAKVLGYFTGKLLDQVQEGTYAPDVRLAKGAINVMDLSGLPLGVQQLVVDSVFRWLLKKEHKVILVLEEAINFIPMAEKVQFETSARKFIREGRSAELFLWCCGQALTETDIAIRKQMRVWILGPQMEENEAAKFMRQVPMKGVKPDQIQKLPTGHFIAAIRRSEQEGGQVEVKRLYTQPVWLPDDVAVKIAKGQATLKDAMRFKHKPEKKAVKTMDEDERKKYESEITKLKEAFDELHKERVRDLAVRDRINDSLRHEIADLKKELEETKATRQVIAREVIRENLGAVFPDLPQKSEVPAIVEGDIDLDTLARKVGDLVEARILAKIPKGQVIEVPVKRVILSTFLEGHVQRIKEPITKLPDRAKRYLAYLSTKDGYMGTKSVAIALFGYGSDAATIAKSLADVGGADYDSQHGRVRYALLENLKKDLQGQYEISDEELADIHTTLQHEFLGMVKERA